MKTMNNDNDNNKNDRGVCKLGGAVCRTGCGGTGTTRNLIPIDRSQATPTSHAYGPDSSRYRRKILFISLTAQ